MAFDLATLFDHLLGDMDLLAGAYLFSFSVHSADHKTNYHRLDNSFPVTVRAERRYEGMCFLPVAWEHADMQHGAPG